MSSSGKGYTVKGSGTNSQPNQGNHYCSRDYGSGASNSNSYHYSNTNGSYYYSNPNGSTYYNNGSGSSTYTPPLEDPVNPARSDRGSSGLPWLVVISLQMLACG
ncbi:hypothetical protein N7489_004007 [Penicillium chrysogenum]|uniref:uncharacterized protein n=1 Tax=Penicillium chrysogenum TaxID=5076 RepID=UPI0024DF28FD|nr:uncharacterized protein N7489_004007 [Penicillium chrysogenum]KAJ5243911.1 hypothetical protein N7489_004007 [Penicillium chrysogenum]